MYDILITERGPYPYGADDEGNAQAVANLHGDRFLHTTAYGWMVGTGTHWESNNAEAKLDRAIIDTLKKRRIAAVRDGYEAIVGTARASAARVKACKYLLESILRVSIDEFDSDPDSLNCANGVLNLRTGELQNHHPDQRFTYCLDVAYDPEADQSTWVNWLRQALNYKTELLSYVQEAVGYSLTGYAREEVLFYLFGPARAGKGIFLETLLAVLGWRPLADEVDFESFTSERAADTQNFDLAGLRPCRFVAASESNKSRRLNAAKIKRLTGGNMIRCAHKYRDFFSYRPQFKVWLSSNWPVNTDVDDEAAWGRFRVIEFPNSHLGREDKLLKERMLRHGNLEGVLAWAIEGAQRWYQRPNGLEAPDCVMVATRSARASLDFVGKWLDECVQITRDHADFVPNPDLHANYRKWCHDNGVRPKPKAKLTQALKAKGLDAGKSKRFEGRVQRGCAGIRWLVSDVDG